MILCTIYAEKFSFVGEETPRDIDSCSPKHVELAKESFKSFPSM